MADRLHWETDGADWPHREASRFVVAGGCRWHVQVMGAVDAPALWLLHGTGASSHSWRALLPLLAGSGGWRLVVPDLPGHGFSGRLPAGQQSLPGMAASLGALATALALAPAAIVGHSAGAALALRALLDGRLGAQRVLGLNAALLPFDGLAGRVFAPLARLLSSQSLVPWLFARQARNPAALQRLVAATGSRLDPEGLALYARLLRSPAHVAGALAMMADWDLATLWHDLPRLTLPLDLLVATADGTVPPAQALRVQQRLPATRVQDLAGLGHLAHEEAPSRVAEALLAWLASSAPATAAA